MDSILFPTEIEFYIDTMRIHDIHEVGNHQWLEWHQRLQKLNQEALIEASVVKEEYVKETLVSFGKVKILIHEAILINIWKHKVLPHLLKMEPYPESTMIAYSVLYHEAVCVALLELVTYHANCCEALEDNALDLLDYACGLSARLLSVTYIEPKATKENAIQELDRQRDNLTFDIGIRSLTIIRYISEYMESLTLSVYTSMYTTHDVPVLFIEILKMKPWIKGRKQYSCGAWKDWDGEVLCQPEAQVWLTIRQLLLDPACQQYYPITETRKSQIVSIMPYMTPTLLDQLAPLIELKHWLSQVTLVQQPSIPSKPLLLESVLEIREKIIEQAGGKWKKIAQTQLPLIFINNKEHLIETAKILNDAYNTDLLEKFDFKEDAVSCSQCGKSSVQRCSQCKKVWYCSRKCQVMHWNDHKATCVAATA